MRFLLYSLDKSYLIKFQMKKSRFLVLLGSLIVGANVLGQGSIDTETRMLKKARKIISQMTVEEKISQMMNEAPGIERLGIKPYDWWSEGLHGVARNGCATVFPAPIGIGATFDPNLIEQVGDVIATEGRAKYNVARQIGNYGRYAGLTYWSPNVNIFRDPRWGRGQETYGEDPYLTAEIGKAYVRGLQGNDPFFLKAAACAKHYAVHSGPEALRHEFNASPSKRDLFETYLPAFEALVKEAKVEAVMGAYNRVYGESASGSFFLLTDILRKKWGFKGHVVSDCGAVDDIYGGHKIAKDVAEASAIALKSGLNLNCGGSFHALKEALERKLITEVDLDNALMPLMMTRLKLGNLTDDDESPYKNISDSVIASYTHAMVAREVAQKSMVLLKNNNHTLPLKKDVKTIFVAGPYAADTYVMMGNYYGVSPRSNTFLQGIAAKVSGGTSINYKIGILPTTPNMNPADWTVGEVRAAEVAIVVIGLSGIDEGEEGDAIASSHRGDKQNLKLPEHQLKFLRDISRNRWNKLVTVITGGSPIDLEEVSELSDAVIMAWYPGQEGGMALGDLLFGDVSFSGRMPVTFPINSDWLPAFEDYNMQGRTYKYMTDNIMYPFGYGLTYGDVSYSDVKILNPKYDGKQEIHVQATLRNNGNNEVEEVVQLYLSAPGAGVITPISSLIGFKRVTLESHLSQTVEFIIKPDQLKMVMEDGSKNLLKGKYTIIVSGAAPCKRSKELGVGESKIDFEIW